MVDCSTGRRERTSARQRERTTLFRGLGRCTVLRRKFSPPWEVTSGVYHRLKISADRRMSQPKKAPRPGPDRSQSRENAAYDACYWLKASADEKIIASSGNNFGQKRIKPSRSNEEEGGVRVSHPECKPESGPVHKSAVHTEFFVYTKRR